MAGTADNWLTERIALGPGKVYGNLGGTNNAPWDLGANVSLLLHSDGTPNSTQNPYAVHLGMTEGGEEWSVKPEKTDFKADEFNPPITSRFTNEEGIISGALLQITDYAVQAIMNPLATRADVAGRQRLTFGGLTTPIFRSFAVIWPVEGDPTKFNVFHLYKAYNDLGIAAQITSKKLGASPFAIRGYAVTTRTQGDQLAELFTTTGGNS